MPNSAAPAGLHCRCRLFSVGRGPTALFGCHCAASVLGLSGVGRGPTALFGCRCAATLLGPAHRLLATCHRPVSVGFGLAAGEEAEFGAEGGSGEAEGFGGAGLEAADGTHDVGEDEGVEALDEMAIELGLIGFHAFVEGASKRVPVS